MSKRILVPVIALVLALSAGSSMAGKLGFGGYISAGYGRTDLTVDPDQGPDIEGDSNQGGIGFGFVFDTGLRDSVFNYRGQLGFEVMGANVDYDAGGDDDLGFGGIVLDNDFGFRIHENSKVRLWIGPRVRIGVFGGEFDDDNHQFDQNDDKADVRMVELGVGPVFGVNVHLNPKLDLAVSGGWRRSWYRGEVENDNDDDFDLKSDGGNGFINVGLLWRPR